METKDRVSIIKTELGNGRIDYCLQFRPPLSLPSGQIMEFEELNFQSYSNPANEIERNFNTSIETLAEEIRCQRYIQVIRHDYGFLMDTSQYDALHFMRQCGQMRNSKYSAALISFARYCQKKCTFGDINLAFLENFKAYLLNAKRVRNIPRYSTNTASSYLRCILKLLRLAYQQNYLSFDPFQSIKSIPWDHNIKKERLTDNEILVLAGTQCIRPDVKKAALLSIYTGLRRSDVLNLKWESLEYVKGRYFLSEKDQQDKAENDYSPFKGSSQVIGKG